MSALTHHSPICIHYNSEFVSIDVCVHGWAIPASVHCLQLVEVGHGKGEWWHT